MQTTTHQQSMWSLLQWDCSSNQQATRKGGEEGRWRGWKQAESCSHGGDPRERGWAVMEGDGSPYKRWGLRCYKMVHDIGAPPSIRCFIILHRDEGLSTLGSWEGQYYHYIIISMLNTLNQAAQCKDFSSSSLKSFFNYMSSLQSNRILSNENVINIIGF